jgi:hypothetical protein
MSRRNSQRKPGTTRGSLRRSRTAKALRISRQAAKSRCAREWDGWGRLSDDDPRQNNSGPSEDPWGGGLPSLHGGASTPNRPDAVRDIREYGEMHERRQQTNPWPAYAGSRLKLSDALGRHRRKCQPSSRAGENPPYGMIGGIEETSASSKPGPRLDPTQLRGARGNSRPYRERHMLAPGSSSLTRNEIRTRLAFMRDGRDGSGSSRSEDRGPQITLPCRMSLTSSGEQPSHSP